MILPSSTWSLAPEGRLSPSGNCTSATGACVSLGTRILTKTINCPVLVRTAVSSTAHSSGAARLGLEQRATQPGGGGASPWVAELVCAAFGVALDLADCCAEPGGHHPKITTARR